MNREVRRKQNSCSLRRYDIVFILAVQVDQYFRSDRIKLSQMQRSLFAGKIETVKLFSFIFSFLKKRTLGSILAQPLSSRQTLAKLQLRFLRKWERNNFQTRDAEDENVEWAGY